MGHLLSDACGSSQSLCSTTRLSALRLNPDIDKYWERFNSNQLVANVHLEFKSDLKLKVIVDDQTIPPLKFLILLLNQSYAFTK